MDRSVWHADLFQARVSALLLIVVVCGLYGPTLGYSWAYEDKNDMERFLASFAWSDVWAYQRVDRLVTHLSYGLSRWLSPMEPWGYHAVSIALHALNTVLLFWLGRLIWAGVWPAFVCAALFAVHPLQTESVAYISARPDLVMTTGVLLALLAVERERWGWMLAACVLAVLGKESGIVAAPLALFWAAWRATRMPVWLRLMAILGCLGAASYLMRFHFFGVVGIDLAYTATETGKLWHLLGKVFVPVNLSIDHDYGAWGGVWPWLSLVAMVGIGCLAVISVRAWAFGVLFVLIALAPRLLVPLVEGLHEHHLYAPLVGICLALVATFTKGPFHGISETSAQA